MEDYLVQRINIKQHNCVWL